MVRRRTQASLRSLRKLGCGAVSNHEAGFHPSRRGQVVAPQDKESVIDHAQLLAPVTCAKAAWLMVVPISDSIFVTYCATCSSAKPRCRVSFSFFSSSEAASTCGTVTSVTRYTIHSLP